MSEERPINVRIMDIEYRVACSPEDESDLRHAAEQLNATMQDIRDTGKVLGTERVAVMAALNASYELLKAQRQQTVLDAATRSRAQQMLSQIDSVLKFFELDDD
jgi:cell division protein ZapA